MHWRRRCCRLCSKAGASGLELPQIEPEPAAQAALREPATTRLWLELLAFAAGSTVSGESFAPAGAAAAGAAVQAGAA